MFLLISELATRLLRVSYFISLRSDSPKTKDATEDNGNFGKSNSQCSVAYARHQASYGLTDPMYLQNGG